MSNRPFEIAAESVTLLTTIESGENEESRFVATEKLSQIADPTAGRVMMEIYDRCMWRSTQVAIIRSLGPMNFQRGNEFLIRLASDQNDLALAQEAILSMGNSGNPFVGEFLLSVLQERDHPLCKEAVIALSRMQYFPSEEALHNYWIDH